MTPDRIKKLELKNYPELSSSFNLSQDDEIFQYSLDKVIEERCDELDYMLEDEGFEILKRDMTRVATSIYNYKVIVMRTAL